MKRGFMFTIIQNTKTIQFFLYAFILCISHSSKAQDTQKSFDELKQTVAKLNPQVDFSNKLVFVSVWKSTDFESREINKEAYRVYKIYKQAKLKNAENGVVFISINLDTDSQNRILAVGKDGIEESLVYSDDQLINLVQSGFNLSATQNTIVIDKTGAIQNTNMPKDQIFPSLRNLITR